jgi:hypothetical protein
MKIIFKPAAFKKFRAYVNGIELEISGFGKVEKVDGNLVVTDVKIFPQVVSAGHTEMDARSLAAFWDELMVAGEDIGKWKLWWHSHVYMTAAFSGTDTDTIDEFDSEMPEENWMLSIVTNKLGNLLARIDVFQPIRCIINNVAWEVEQTDEEITVDVQSEIAEKVKTQDHSSGGSFISWYHPRVPITKEGKMISMQERLKQFQRMSRRDLWPPELPLLNDGKIIDGEIILDNQGNSTQ